MYLRAGACINISLSSQAFKNPETEDSLIYKCRILKAKLKIGPPFSSQVIVSWSLVSPLVA